MNGMAQAAAKKRVSVGVLFWIAFILLVLVIFLANRSNIQDILESTGLVNVMRDRFATEEADNTPAPTEDTESVNTTDEPTGVAFDELPARTEPGTAPSVSDSGAVPITDAPQKTPVVVSQNTSPADQQPVAQRAPSPDPTKPNRLMADLYFIRVSSEGRIYPHHVVRPVYYDSSPLTETINALISGPVGNELEDGLLNLIPNGTELLSAHVQNSVAYLNFNQAFRFNQMGAEGTVAQLVQIIFASTEFPTVDRVQFLIEGERVEYLSGEGVYVGEPLGRDAFG